MAERQLPSGHVTREITNEEKEEITKNFLGLKDNYDINEYMVRAYPGGWFMSSLIHKYADNIYNFKWKPDDVLIISYPKSGTNWTLDVVWTMLKNKDFAHPDQNLIQAIRCPIIEADILIADEDRKRGAFGDHFEHICPGKSFEDGIFWQMAQSTPSPRVLFTHLHYSFFRNNPLDTCKVIYVARNPKDVLLSYHHFHNWSKLYGYVGSFDDFINFFINDKVVYSPYWTHVKAYWSLRNNPKMMFIFYEELRNNTRETYSKLNDFLQAGLSDSEIEKVIEFCSFQKMKERLSGQHSSHIVNDEVERTKAGFYRKGKSGSWKTEMTESQIARMDEWIQENTRGTGINFS